jgi:hypothetical protein
MNLRKYLAPHLGASPFTPAPTCEEGMLLLLLLIVCWHMYPPYTPPEGEEKRNHSANTLRKIGRVEKVTLNKLQSARGTVRHAQWLVYHAKHSTKCKIR